MLMTDPETAKRAREAFAAHVEPIKRLLAADNITDIMLNPPQVWGEPGSVWIDVVGSGLEDSGIRLTAYQAEAIMREVGAQADGRRHFDARNPVLSCQAAGGQFRFEGLIPPAVPFPTFTLRKYIVKDVKLSDYADEWLLTGSQYETLQEAATNGLTVLLGGETGSGKTTMLNALIRETAADRTKRLLLIEDTPELDLPPGPSARLTVTSDDAFSYAAAVKSALRMRPNTIVLGEARDGEAALRVVEACTTGHQGFATLHAGSCQQMLWRLYSLCRQCEAGRHIMERTISDAVQLTVHIKRVRGRRVIDVQRVVCWDGTRSEYVLEGVE